MSVLDIDAGNTRLKWQELRRGVVVSSGAIANSDISGMVDDVGDALSGRVSACRVSSVRGRDVVEGLLRALKKRFCIDPVLPEPRSGIGGLVVEGVSPSRLGDDRWLAMLGAIKLYPEQPVIIVDSGTALTLDVVDRHGAFRGGLICPGVRTMLQAMADSADRLVLPEKLELQRGVALSSLQAVQNGALSMATSVIEREVARLGGNAVVILCGGDAPLLAECVDISVQMHPDLVFEGLRVALPIEEGE